MDSYGSKNERIGGGEHLENLLGRDMWEGCCGRRKERNGRRNR